MRFGGGCGQNPGPQIGQMENNVQFEERVKAVELYIQFGYSEGIVIRTLGYPSYTALRNWYKEYFSTGSLHATSSSKPRYTEAQKVAAVEYYASNRTTLTQACRTLGYPARYVLKRWILKIRPELLENIGPLAQRQAFNKIHARAETGSSRSHADSRDSGLQGRCSIRCQ